MYTIAIFGLLAIAGLFLTMVLLTWKEIRKNNIFYRSRNKNTSNVSYLKPGEGFVKEI